MGIHVHFEYNEDDYTVYEGVITPTAKDLLEYLDIAITDKTTQISVEKVLEELISNDLLDESNENFVEFIKEKYYEIKRR